MRIEAYYRRRRRDPLDLPERGYRVSRGREERAVAAAALAEEYSSIRGKHQQCAHWLDIAEGLGQGLDDEYFRHSMREAKARPAASRSR
jgi:hypothetical protein